MVFGECHAHVIMDGINYRNAVDLHNERVDESVIHRCFQEYKKRGVTFVRDGGDAGGVSDTARRLAPLYNIDYRTPLYAIHKSGHYGGIVGRGFNDFREYAELVRDVRRNRGDFIKIMVSGLMDFTGFGILTEDGLSDKEIREMVHIAHEEGMAVMAHTNGVLNIHGALAAGVDSLEHGAYMDEECVAHLAETNTVWVPTISTILNMLGDGRFDDGVLREIGGLHGERIRQAWSKGAKIALGSDAGAYTVYHGSGIEDEYRHILNILGPDSEPDQRLAENEDWIRLKFSREE